MSISYNSTILKTLSSCRNAEPEKYGVFFVFSVKLTTVTQIIGFSTRFFSLFLWIQIYRLGASNVIHRVSPEAVVEDCEAADVGSSLLSPKPYETFEQCSNSNINPVDSMYDPPLLCTSDVTHKILPKAVDERNHLRPCETLSKCSESDYDFEDFIYDPTLLPIIFQEAKDEKRLQKVNSLLPITMSTYNMLF